MDDGRCAPSDGKSSHCLWQGELTTVIGQICRSTRTHYSDSEPSSLCSFSLILRSQRRSNKYQFYILCLTKPQFVPTIYRTRGEHANHYATDAVPYFYFIFIFFLIKISYCPSIYYLKTKINPKQKELLDIYINSESSYFCSNSLLIL